MLTDTRDLVNSISPPAGRVPHTSLGSAINLVTLYGAGRVQGIKISAGGGTVTYKDEYSGATPRTETVAQGDVLLGRFTSIDSVSGVTEIVVLIARQ